MQMFKAGVERSGAECIVLGTGESVSLDAPTPGAELTEAELPHEAAGFHHQVPESVSEKTIVLKSLVHMHIQLIKH